MYVVLQTKKHVVMIASQLKMTTIAIQNKTKITIICDPDDETGNTSQR